MNLDPERLDAKSSELLHYLLKQRSFAVFCKDINSGYFNCNGLFLADCGFDSLTGILGKSDYDLPWTKEEAAFFRLIDREVISNGICKPKFIETQTDFAGRRNWIETGKYPLFGIEGNILGLVGHYHRLD